jgi:ABC-2 type transport system permease protein
MVPQDLWLNAFGWDRGGARALFLAPLEPRRVLAGKNLAMAAYATALLAGAAAAAVAAGGWPPTWALAGAAALHLALGPMLLGAGNLVSIWNPRASGFTLRRAKNLPALSGLAGMAIVSGAVGLLALPALLAARLDEPWVLVGGWVAAAAAAWAAYLTTLRRVGALLEARRERLLAEVCGDEG